MAVKKAPTSKTKAVAAKPAVKKVSQAKKPAKAPVTKVVDTQVPVKENIDMVQNVLSIKAHNEEVKKAKVAKKAVSKPAPKAVVKETKTPQAKAERSKSQTVKAVAQKAATKKFAEVKEAEKAVAKPCCCCCGIKKGWLGAWARAYKNIFNFKGRTSRYEFWAYCLFNMVFAFVLGLVLSVVNQNTVVQSGQPCVWCDNVLNFFSVVWTLVAISLTVRRLHDCGYTAWKGFFRPVVAWCIVLFALAIASEQFKLDTTEVAQQHLVLSLFIGLTGIVSILAVIYYTVKICLVSGYYEEEKADNAYGVVAYNDDCYKKHGIRYASWFWTIITVVMITYIAYMTNIAMMILSGVAG